MRPPAELYDDVEFIAQGGMARVYRARRKESGRIVAVREIPGGTDSEPRIESERQGAEIQRALSAIDRRVPKVFDVSLSATGWLYVEMELVDGEDLADALQRGPLPVPDAVRIICEIFDFLRVAHGQAVEVNGERREHQVHGDLTPRNVRIASDGSVRILDFGIAKGLKATLTAQAFANYGYISPERARTGRMGMADDYWSAGVLFYEMLAGARAFPGTAEEIRSALATRRPPLPLDTRIPRPVRAIVARLLAWDPAFRYPTAAAVLDDLRCLQEGRRTQAEAAEEAARTRLVAAPASPVTSATTVAVGGPHRHAPAAAAVGRPLPPVSPMPPRSDVREPALPDAAARKPRTFPWKRAVLAATALVVFLHEQPIRREADASARVAAAETVAPDRLLSQLESLRGRAWLDMTTRHFAEVVVRRLSAQAIATLKDYREDLPTIRKPHFEAARGLLARAVRIDAENRLTTAWLRYAEGHLARIDAESGREDERRPLLRQAMARFEEAAALAPNLPDPHLALARIYTYYIRDPERARRAMQTAERLGQAPGLRGHAQLGDLLRAEGESLVHLARDQYGTPSEEPALLRARTELTAAVEEYDKARGFAQSARNGRQAGVWIAAIDDRLAELRQAAIDVHDAGGDDDATPAWRGDAADQGGEAPPAAAEAGAGDAAVSVREPAEPERW
jgi:serine/threonine-protein kinase